VTSDLVKRIWEHKNHAIDGFSKTYNLNKLVYYEVVDDIEAAINREKYLKGKTRSFKKDLIQNFNPKWEDLYDKIC
jgi:putative endonuclease